MVDVVDDTIDFREVGRALFRGRRWIFLGAAVGLAVAVAISVLARPTYEGRATVLLRSDAGRGMSALPGRGGGLGGLADVLSVGSAFETELEILTSRSVIGAVVDSLALQVRVVRPSGARAADLFLDVRTPHELSRRTYHFVREGAGYRVVGSEEKTFVRPGVPHLINDVFLTLTPGELPQSFVVEVIGREQAIDRVKKRLDAGQLGGDIAELVFDAADPVIAATVPNTMIEVYLQRRKTIDRGVNQHRYEFLLAHADSIAIALEAAERSLRTYQEGSGVLDPVLTGETEVEQAAKLRANLEELEVESSGLAQVLARGPEGARALAAYPSLLRNGAINNILARLLDYDARRAELLERRTEQDPDVIMLGKHIQQLELELASLARAYLDGMKRQEAQIRRELEGYRSSLAVLPERSQRILGLQREVKRLSETLVALQTQLVQTRLAAIAEGGEVRQVDLAIPPERPAFPRPVLLLLIGLFGGAFLGVIAALMSVYLGRYIMQAGDAEMSAGVPAFVFDPKNPVLLGGIEKWRSLLVIPLGGDLGSSTVARHIASTAALQRDEVVVVEFESSMQSPARVLRMGEAATPVMVSSASDSTTPAFGRVPADIAASRYRDGNPHWGEAVDGSARFVYEELERRYSFVVASLPGLQHPSTASVLAPHRPVVLVAEVAVTTRAELTGAVATLRRVGVPVAGVVLHSQ